MSDGLDGHLIDQDGWVEIDDAYGVRSDRQRH